MSAHREKIVILDFGSQYTQLIARRVRECGVFCEILPYNTKKPFLKDADVKGVILSGGPCNVNEADAPSCSKEILMSPPVPLLGICYGMQLMVSVHGGKVSPSDKREYGRARLSVSKPSQIFEGILPEELDVWMSHSDSVEKLPLGFSSIASTEKIPYAAVVNDSENLFGLQFHPEVVHTPCGTRLIKNFLYGICGLSGGWSMKSFAVTSVEDVAGSAEAGNLLCGISGGVDSSVAAILVSKAVGGRLTCVFINNGLLRKGEADAVLKTYRDEFHLEVDYVDAEERFLNKLKGVTDPERKRKIIGGEFIKVFEEEARRIGNFRYLVQGTLYPDVIESVSVRGPSATIKTHHNVGGLPDDMELELIEPLRELFKDEVRELGKELGLSEEILWRHPFPGPGLGVRILGEITRERLGVLREADAIFIEEIKAAGLYHTIWQAFAVLLPVKTVGVMGDERTYENVIALRAVSSEDGMTADWSLIPHEVLGKISNRIINEVRGVNRVTYDISSKPPGTIEWE